MISEVKMSKLQSVIIVCVTITYLSLEISAAEPVAFTKQWTTDYHTYKPYVVKVKDQVIVVGLRNNAVILTSIDGVEINTCNFSLSSPDKIAKPVARPVALGNGKLVVNTIMRSSNDNKDLTSDKVRSWELFVIVDPHDCSKTKTLEVDNKGWNLMLAGLVPYHDTFDLFFGSNARNVSGEMVLESPRRFNDQAEPVPLDHHFGPETNIWGFHIQSIKPYDASEGYICTVVNKIDNSMKLKRLGSKFQLVQETEVQPWAHAMSATFGKVSLCYLTANFITQTFSNGSDEVMKKLTTTCDFYDIKDLSHQGSVRSFSPNSAYDESYVAVVNLPDGSAVAALGFRDSTFDKDNGYTTKYYLQRFKADGGKGEVVNVGSYTSHFDLMKEVSLDGGAEVCLIVVGEKEPSIPVRNIKIEVAGMCIDMSK